VIFLYFLAEGVYDPQFKQSDGEEKGEVMTILLLSFPYLLDFITGVSTFMLAWKIFQYEERLEEIKR